MTIEMPAEGAEEHPRGLGFKPDSTVDVRQVSDKEWMTLSALTYHAQSEDFEVPAHAGTDFASVPREFVWFIPCYGRYTKAAILHDYLCRVLVPVGHLHRIDADGIFRQAMRELGVPFLRRWIMWAAVRWSAVTEPTGRSGWWKEAWRVAVVSVIALPIVAPAAAVIVLTLLIWYLAEWITWIPLKMTHSVQSQRRRQTKRVNTPTLGWNL